MVVIGWLATEWLMFRQKIRDRAIALREARQAYRDYLAYCRHCDEMAEEHFAQQEREEREERLRMSDRSAEETGRD